MILTMKHTVFFLIIFTSTQAFCQNFHEEIVEITYQDISLSGTLSFPDDGNKPHKAIILISGSGAQDRDVDVSGFKTYQRLASFFNSEGYAVLRYDDRGVGQSTGKSVGESTSFELAEDVRQAYLYLKSRLDIDQARIGLYGHSEGGIIAPMVAAREPDIAFIILAAGYGVPGSELSNTQREALLRLSGMSETFIKASLDLYSDVFQLMGDTTTSDEQLSEFVKRGTLELLPKMPEAVQTQITDPEAYANLTAQQTLAQFKSPWVRHYLTYDPLPVLKEVTCPTLLLFGELDQQISPQQNKEIMTNALLASGNTNVEAIIIPQANHLFQKAVTGSPVEYATLDKEFATEFLEVLGDWLEKINR